MASPSQSGGPRENFLLSLLHGSLILTALDRFTAYIYFLLKRGFFGFLFSGYRHDLRSCIPKIWSESKAAEGFRTFRSGVCSRIESSVIVYLIEYLAKFLLGCRLKVYGAFFASFGVYTALVTVILAVAENSLGGLFSHPYLIISLAMLLASLPLLLSKNNLSEGLTGSLIGRGILVLTGFSEEDVRDTVGDGGHSNTAFLFGMVAGALTYAVNPLVILGAVAILNCAYLILIRPELGVVALFFGMPLLPTMLLAMIVVYTALCYAIKLFRGKRIFRLEPVDIVAAAFAVLLAAGGVISLSPASLKPALLMVCLICGYFLTIGLIRTREWLIRCSVSCVVSASLVSLYGIFMYFTGGGYSSTAWLDDEMFSAIGGRAVATLENPNMLGEYLILILPIAVSMLIGRGEGMRRFEAFLCIGIMGICLILTWSRGAWLGLIFAALLFLFMWHHRSVWIVLLGIASLPILPSVLPASIVARFTSIGNMADSSTSYRVYIWRASVNMIRDHSLTGIGIGEGAWQRLYPLYSYLGVEAAPHSHNLYLQIWLELGLFGILIFVLFLFLMYQSSFTMFYGLSENGLKMPDISAASLRRNRLTGSSNAGEEMRRSKNQLRISTAGPLCGIFAVLVQGMTDYAWYNYRLYLMFWLVCALAMAYTRDGRSRIGSVFTEKHIGAERYHVEVPLKEAKRSPRNRNREERNATSIQEKEEE